jgi:hypothetical protein
MPTKSRSDKNTSKRARSPHSNRSGSKSNAGSTNGSTAAPKSTDGNGAAGKWDSGRDGRDRYAADDDRADRSTAGGGRPALSNQLGPHDNRDGGIEARPLPPDLEGADAWSRSRGPVDDNRDRDDRGRFGSDSKSTRRAGSSSTSSPRRSQTGSRR